MGTLVNESMTIAPLTGTLVDNNAYAGWKVGGYFGLNNDVNQYGDFYYNGDITTNWDMTVDMQMGVTNGADGCWFYWGWNTHPQTEGDSTNAGYMVNRNDFSNTIEIRFGGSVLASASYTKDTNFDTLEVSQANAVITVKYKGSTLITYTDPSYPRSLPGNEYGWGSRSGGTGNTHNIKNLLLITVGSSPSASISPSASSSASISPSASVSPSSSSSASLSPSTSISPSASLSPSASISPSASASASLSPSSSQSPSASRSPSSSISLSISPSASQSPSASRSPSSSASASLSPSSSSSASLSPSSSRSPSSSLSPSSSVSPSAGMGCHALQFDGSQNHVAVAGLNNQINYAAITVACRVMFTSTISSPRIISNSHTDSNNKGFQLYASSGSQLLFMVGNGTSQTNSQKNGTISLNTPISLIGVYDGANVTLYVNGVAQSAAALTGSIALNPSDLWLSGNPDYNGDFLNGIIDSVAIYNRALTPTEISNLYNNDTFPASGLVAKYLIDEGAGTEINDSSGNGNNGVLTGSPLPQWVSGLFCSPSASFSPSSSISPSPSISPSNSRSASISPSSSQSISRSPSASVSASGELHTLSADLFRVLFPKAFASMYTSQDTQFIRKYPPVSLRGKDNQTQLIPQFVPNPAPPPVTIPNPVLNPPGNPPPVSPSPSFSPPPPALVKRGTALSGLEFGTGVGGQLNTDYFNSAQTTYNYFANKGFKTLRLPFTWERLQPTLFAPLDTVYAGILDAEIQKATNAGIKVILDVHNFGRYRVIAPGGFTDTFPAFFDPLVQGGTPGSGVLQVFSFQRAILGSTLNPVAPANGYHIKTDVSLVQDFGGQVFDNGWIEFFRTDDNNKYFFTMNAQAGQKHWELYKVVAGIQTLLSTGLFNFNYGDTNTIDIDINQDFANKITVKINNAQVTQVNTDSALTHGHVSVFSVSVQINLSNFSLNVNNDTTSANANSGTFIVGSSQVPFTAFADLWTRIAQRYVNNQTVFAYDLMNEPHDMLVPTTPTNFNTTSTVTRMMQAAINAVRAVDTNHYIVAELDQYAGAQNFVNNYGSNPTPFLTDSANKLVYSFHYYFDNDHSGTYPIPFAQSNQDAIAVDVTPILVWARNNGEIIHCGEYGVPNDNSWQGCLSTFLALMNTYDGWANQWAAGDQYSAITVLQPTGTPPNFTDRLQMVIVGATPNLGD